MLFREHLCTLAIEALGSLTTSKSKGKVPNNPLSESHFFSVWVSKALKEKSFDSSMAPLLRQWQQRARTQGAGANLKAEFESIVRVNQGLAEACHKISREKFEQLIQTLSVDEWQISRLEHIGKKHSIKKEKESSLALDKNQYDNAFDEQGDLKVNVSVFVRGGQQAFIDHAYSHGLLIFKVTDYKSAVKFHGEFVIAPHNNFTDIPQFITEN